MRILCGVAALLLLCANASFADAPQDVVVLTSGNRIVGEVRELSRGELAFRIAGIGTVDINWSAVESLETSQILDVELTSGQRLAGSITTTPDGKLTVMTKSGPRTIEKADSLTGCSMVKFRIARRTISPKHRWPPTSARPAVRRRAIAPA